MQINHAGRQSPIGAGNRPFRAKTLSPSPIPLNLGDGIVAHMASSFLFGTPREMTDHDIHKVIQQFVHTSQLAQKAGFNGIEIHAAHGYLLSQFLSAKSNHRTDAYGGSPGARAKIVVDIINAIRATVPTSFCVGVKLNSVDHQSAKELRDCVEQLKLIAATGIDFLEISGGTWENPEVCLLLNSKGRY